MQIVTDNDIRPQLESNYLSLKPDKGKRHMCSDDKEGILLWEYKSRQNGLNLTHRVNKLYLLSSHTAEYDSCFMNGPRLREFAPDEI